MASSSSASIMHKSSSPDLKQAPGRLPSAAIVAPPLSHSPNSCTESSSSSLPPSSSATLGNGSGTWASPWLSFLAGSIAGGVGQFIGFPLDSLKVRAQLGLQPSFNIRSLYRGCLAPIATAGMTASLALGTYETARQWLTPSGTSTPLWMVGICGTISGIVVSPLTTVVSRVKVLQQSSAHSHGAMATMRQLLVTRTLFCGFWINTAAETPRSVYMVVYVGMKRALGDEATPSPTKKSFAGAVAGIASWFVMYPMDVVRSAIHATLPGGPQETTTQVVRRLWAEGGPSRFFVGLVPTLIRAGPVAGVLLPTFDVTLDFLHELLGPTPQVC